MTTTTTQAIVFNTATNKHEIIPTGTTLDPSILPVMGGVLEFANKASFPANGQSSMLYADMSTTPPTTYVWDGSAYVSLVAEKKPTIIFFNSTTPATATIFDYTNPPTVNDTSLPNRVDAIYVGTDGSTWISNGTTYKTYVAPASTEWYLGNTTIDAGNNKTGAIGRVGLVGIGTPNPLSTLDASGSQGWEFTSTSAATVTPTTASGFAFDLTLAGTQTFTLPTVARRVYVLRNATTYNKQTSVNYTAKNGLSTNVISSQSVLWLQANASGAYFEISGGSSVSSGNSGIVVLGSDKTIMTSWVAPWTPVEMTEFNVDVPAGKTLVFELLGSATDASGQWAIVPTLLHWQAGDFMHGGFELSNYAIPASSTGGNFYKLAFNSVIYDADPRSTRARDLTMDAGTGLGGAMVKYWGAWTNKGTTTRTFRMGLSPELAAAYTNLNLILRAGSTFSYHIS